MKEDQYEPEEIEEQDMNRYGVKPLTKRNHCSLLPAEKFHVNVPNTSTNNYVILGVKVPKTFAQDTSVMSTPVPNTLKKRKI